MTARCVRVVQNVPFLPPRTYLEKDVAPSVLSSGDALSIELPFSGKSLSGAQSIVIGMLHQRTIGRSITTYGSLRAPPKNPMGSKGNDKKKRTSKKKPKAQPVKPKVEHHKLNDYKKGDTYPECAKGSLGKYAPKELIRINLNTAVKPKKRSGIHASGLIATLNSGHDVFLFKTHIGHVGEWLEEVLQHRSADLSLPIVMSDALSHNHTVIAKLRRTLCNSHARRGFVEQLDNYPDDVKTILKLYKTIWSNDTHCIEQSLSAKERQHYHHTHSLPIMDDIKQRCESALASNVEYNSGLGKAMRYFIKHYDQLIGFCEIEGAQLDNNRIERTLKLIILNRKNTFFYKTAAGAAISDVITSMIATTYHAEINPFDYFNAVQRFRAEVKANPEGWLPWNYESNNAKLLAS